MNKPNTYKDWAEESLGAFSEAYRQLKYGASPIEEKYELFRLAPILAAHNRHISGTDRGIDMLSIVGDIERDFEVDDEARGRYLFNFVFAYIHSHSYAELLDEMEADRIMDYIADNYDLFENV